MTRWLLKSKLLQLRIRTCIIFLLCLIGFIHFFASHGKYNYQHVPREQLMGIIYFRTSPKLQPNKEKPNCYYDRILQNTSSINSWEVQQNYNYLSLNGLANGTYSPENCNALLSVAVLITCVNRTSDLHAFITYMHNFLRKQGIHYSIYVVGQADDKPFNRGLLFNIGAKEAIADRYPCLIFHDVDHLPLDYGNLYACLHEPRHMSASTDKFRYVLIYDYFVGGALAIRTDQYISLNGFSNKFNGWGGQDDDMAERIAAGNLKILRFPRELSRYTMISHHQDQKNKELWHIMSDDKIHRHKDGLNSAEYAIKRVNRNKLFTMISVTF